MTVNLAIGQVTPQMAVDFCVAANLAKITLGETPYAVIRFILRKLRALLITMYFPFLSLWIPYSSGSTS
jgi:C4-dicarboxylate transporter, DctM subunit